MVKGKKKYAMTFSVASKIFSPSTKICRLSGVTFTSTDSENKNQQNIQRFAIAFMFIKRIIQTNMFHTIHIDFFFFQK